VIAPLLPTAQLVGLSSTAARAGLQSHCADSRMPDATAHSHRRISTAQLQIQLIQLLTTSSCYILVHKTLGLLLITALTNYLTDMNTF